MKIWWLGFGDLLIGHRDSLMLTDVCCPDSIYLAISNKSAKPKTTVTLSYQKDLKGEAVVAQLKAEKS